MTTMDDHCQVRPPRNIGCENHACATCSCNHANDSAISELSNCNRRCGCARSRPSIAKCRQTSVTSGDSGLGLSLNPITEQEDCSATDIGDSCARWSKNPTRERHNSRDPECYCSHDENVSSEESGLMFKSTCCCENTESNTNARTLARTVSSEPHAIGRTRICKSGRARTRSESCATENYIATSNTRMDFPPQNHNMAEIYAPQQCMKKNVHDLNASYRDVRRSPYRRMYVFMIFVTMISLGSIAFAYVGYSNNKLQFNGTESKIQELQDALDRLHKATPLKGAHAPIISGAPEAKKPHIHMLLNASTQIRKAKWGGDILSWIPEFDPSEEIRYNRRESTISVKDPGQYFVYNQVYVVRGVHGQTLPSGHVTRQTVMHVIYKIPFNYPKARKPISIAEGVVSHCWNKDANTQIHTSYQGIIVNVDRHEQLLVGLDSYDQDLDKLLPSSTFFGMFKL